MAPLKLWEVSQHQMQMYRWPYVLLASIQIALSGGVIYGWSALEFVLISQGFETDEEKLRSIAASGIVATTISPLFLGIFLDKLGPRFCCCFGLGLTSIGIGVLGTGSHLYFAYLAVAFGCPAAQIGSVHLSGLFAKRSAFVLSIMTGSFQISFLIFPLFKSMGLPLMAMCVPYAIILAILALSALLFYPDTVVTPISLRETAGERDTSAIADTIEAGEAHNSIEPSNENTDAVDITESCAGWPRPTPSGMATRDVYPSMKQQMWSWSFIALFVYMPISVLFLNHITTDARKHVESIVGTDDNALVESIVDYFGFFLPAGMFFVPLLGYSVDRFGMVCGSFIQHSSFTLYAALLAFATLSWQLLYAAWFVYAIARSWSFTMFFQVLGSEFTPAYYGTMQGILFSVSSLLFFLHNPFLDLLGRNFILFSWLQLGIVVPMYAYTLYWKSRHSPKAAKIETESSAPLELSLDHTTVEAS